MKLQKSLRLALNILLHSQLRSWLTIIGIVIGVAAIVAIVSIGEGAQASVEDRLGDLGADIITVSGGSNRAIGGFRMAGEDRQFSGAGSGTSAAKNLTLRDVQTIKSVAGVAYINGIVSGRADFIYLAQTASVSVQGVYPLAWSNMVTTELASGRYLNPGDTNAIVIGYRIASTTFKQQLVLNRMVTIEGRAFKIVGILKESGSFGGEDNAVYMPMAAAREVLGKNLDSLDSISIKAESAELADQVLNETESRLMLSRHVTGRTKDFSVTSAKAMQERITSVTQTFTIFLAAIAMVSLLVGAIGITNTMFTSVLEKTREIGIMKAIGARNSDIMLIFLMNSGLVGLAGGLLGVLVGAGISSILPNFLSGTGVAGPGIGGGLRTVVPLSLLVGALVLSITIGMVAGAIPAYRASKLRPVDALRYE